MKRLLFCSMVVSSAFLLWKPLWPQSLQNPNILLITIDTIRPDSLSCYGGRTKTPNLDEIARAGILYENAFATVPLTFPSHVSILTGLYPSRHGIHHNGLQVFRNSKLTIPHILRTKGYVSGAVISSYVLDRKFGLAENFDFYDDKLVRKTAGDSGFDAERTADQTYGATIELFSKLTGRKWFAWIHFFDPHIPYSPPPPLHGYQGEVSFVDRHVGRLLQWLKQKKLDQNLLLAVVGDHGESLGEHGEATHGFFVYNSTLKVPLLISYPGSKQARVTVPVSTVDLVPTLLQLAGVRDSLSRDGRSLIGGPQIRSVYFESFYPQLHGWNSLQGVIQNEWKFISTTRPELYDIRVDPKEKSNLHAKEAGISSRMRKELHPYIKMSGTEAPVTIDAETREKLESLGYISTTKIVKSDADPKDKIGIWSRYQDFLLLKNAGKHTEAVSLLEKIAKEESFNPFFQIQLAREYRLANKEKEAVQLLTKVVQRDAQREDVYHELALAYQKLRNYPESIRAIQAAIAIQPDRSEFHDTAGILLSQTGKLELAITEFRKGLALDPNNAVLWHNLGNVLRDAGQLEDARKAFQQALERVPSYASAWNGLGTIFFQQGKIQEATRCLLKAKDFDPALHEVYYNLGVAYQASGNAEQARTYYTTFLKLSPESMHEQRNAAKQRLVELNP